MAPWLRLHYIGPRISRRRCRRDRKAKSRDCPRRRRCPGVGPHRRDRGAGGARRRPDRGERCVHRRPGGCRAGRRHARGAEGVGARPAPPGRAEAARCASERRGDRRQPGDGRHQGHHSRSRHRASLDLPFGAVATDLQRGRTVWLREGSTIAAVRASCAMPGLFPPTRYGDRWLVDGGLVDPVPVTCAACSAPTSSSP
jgi:hypothetical protein